MASVKLLLPSSPAVSSTPFFCDRLHRHLSLPSSPLRLQPLVLQTLDSAPALTFSSHSDEILTFGDEFTTSEDEEEGDDEDEDKGDGSTSSVSVPAASAVDDLEGALSKYIWSEPRKMAPQLSRQDRLALVDSIVGTDKNLLNALDGARYKLAPSDFGSMLQQLMQLKKWDKVGLVFDWMKVNKKLKPQSVSNFIMMMGRAGFHYRALRAYKGLTDLNIKLNKFVCNALLKTLVDAGSIEKAFALFDEMKADGFVPDVYSYSTIITGCAKRQGAFITAKKYMAEMSSKGLKPDAFIYASILHVCACFGLEDEAKDLFEEMKANGVEPSIFHYSPLLNMYAEKKKPEEAEKVFQDFKKAGLPLNEVIVNSLIKAYSNSGQLEKASRLFAEMPSLHCPPGEVTYSLMMDSYCKAGQLEEAQLLFEGMKRKGISPGNHAYSILISAYSKLGRADMVESLSKEVETRKQGISDPVLFNSVLKSYCELGMMDAIMKTLKRMNDESVSPDRATFNILICYFCKERMFDIALHTLADLKFRKLRPNLNSYAPLIIGLAGMGKVDRALELYVEMKEAGIRPSASVFNALIDALCKERRADETLKYLKEMVDMDLSPLPSCVEHILILSGSHIEILEEILEDSFRPYLVLNQVNLAFVLSGYQKQGSYVAMHKLLDYVKENDIDMGIAESWDELIDGLQQAGQTEILTRLSERTSKMQLSAASSTS